MSDAEAQNAPWTEWPQSHYVTDALTGMYQDAGGFTGVPQGNLPPLDTTFSDFLVGAEATYSDLGLNEAEIAQRLAGMADLAGALQLGRLAQADEGVIPAKPQILTTPAVGLVTGNFIPSDLRPEAHHPPIASPISSALAGLDGQLLANSYLNISHFLASNAPQDTGVLRSELLEHYVPGVHKLMTYLYGIANNDVPESRVGGISRHNAYTYGVWDGSNAVLLAFAGLARYTDFELNGNHIPGDFGEMVRQSLPPQESGGIPEEDIPQHLLEAALRGITETDYFDTFRAAQSASKSVQDIKDLGRETFPELARAATTIIGSIPPETDWLAFHSPAEVYREACTDAAHFLLGGLAYYIQRGEAFDRSFLEELAAATGTDPNDLPKFEPPNFPAPPEE